MGRSYKTNVNAKPAQPSTPEITVVDDEDDAFPPTNKKPKTMTVKSNVASQLFNKEKFNAPNSLDRFKTNFLGSNEPTTNSLERFKTNFAGSNEPNDAMNRKCNELMVQVKEATVKLSNVNNALGDVNKALDASAKECKRLKNQLEEANKKVALNKKVLDEKDKECNLLKVKVEEGQNKLEKSNLAVEISRKEFLEEYNKLQEKSKKDSEKIDTLTTALDTFKKECELMKSEIKEANMKLQEERKSKNDHNKEKEATQQDNEEIVRNLTNALDQAETECKNLKVQVKDLNVELNAEKHSKSKNGNQPNVKDLKDEIEKVSKKLDIANKECQQLKKEAAEKGATFTNESTKINLILVNIQALLDSFLSFGVMVRTTVNDYKARTGIKKELTEEDLKVYGEGTCNDGLSLPESDSKIPTNQASFDEEHGKKLDSMLVSVKNLFNAFKLIFNKYSNGKGYQPDKEAIMFRSDKDLDLTNLIKKEIEDSPFMTDNQQDNQMDHKLYTPKKHVTPFSHSPKKNVSALSHSPKKKVSSKASKINNSTNLRNIRKKNGTESDAGVSPSDIKRENKDGNTTQPEMHTNANHVPVEEEFKQKTLIDKVNKEQSFHGHSVSAFYQNANNLIQSPSPSKSSMIKKGKKPEKGVAKKTVSFQDNSKMSKELLVNNRPLDTKIIPEPNITKDISTEPNISALLDELNKVAKEVSTANQPVGQSPLKFDEKLDGNEGKFKTVNLKTNTKVQAINLKNGTFAKLPGKPQEKKVPLKTKIIKKGDELTSLPKQDNLKNFNHAVAKETAMQITQQIKRNRKEKEAPEVKQNIERNTVTGVVIDKPDIVKKRKPENPKKEKGNHTVDGQLDNSAKPKQNSKKSLRNMIDDFSKVLETGARNIMNKPSIDPSSHQNVENVVCKTELNFNSEQSEMEQMGQLLPLKDVETTPATFDNQSDQTQLSRTNGSITQSKDDTYSFTVYSDNTGQGCV